MRDPGSILPETVASARRLADPVIVRSEQWYARGLAVIPGATQTLAKGPTQHVRGFAPLYLQRGRGCRVWDVDGNEFLDLQMGIGPLSLGYAWSEVDDAIRAQLEDGITFSLMHPLEVEVAEAICAIVPGAEAVRFSKTGADVTSAAIRLARAVTGRDRVLCCGYHGWHDWYVGTTPRAAGVPAAVRALVESVPYGDLAAVSERIGSQTAAVILEPVGFDPPPPGFLEGLRGLCDAVGALLVFDEMWTGFRLALGGAQERLGVRADLACYSKAVANGMPLSVLAGRRELIARAEHDVFFYTTFGGETLSLAAARATLRALRAHRVPEGLEDRGSRLREGFNRLAVQTGLELAECVGYGCRTQVRFAPGAGDPLLLKSLAQQELLRRGILWGGFHNLSHSHGDAEIDEILACWAEVLAELADAVRAGDLRRRLRGAPVEPVFRPQPALAVS